jgi:hypothetical protein
MFKLRRQTLLLTCQDVIVVRREKEAQVKISFLKLNEQF